MIREMRITSSRWESRGSRRKCFRPQIRVYFERIHNTLYISVLRFPQLKKQFYLLRKRLSCVTEKHVWACERGCLRTRHGLFHGTEQHAEAVRGYRKTHWKGWETDVKDIFHVWYANNVWCQVRKNTRKRMTAGTDNVWFAEMKCKDFLPCVPYR